jgi:pimeloyl-ACP methyl ester carboxylesterase
MVGKPDTESSGRPSPRPLQQDESAERRSRLKAVARATTIAAIAVRRLLGRRGGQGLQGPAEVHHRSTRVGVTDPPKGFPMPPTIVLVHGAFAESASWDRVLDPLLGAGHRVMAAANPLRGLAADATAVSDLVRTLEGPVVLVGHSYGGAVITNVDADAGAIAGLVYVAGFAPAPGESAITLTGLFPGSTLEAALRPVSLSDGTTDLLISQEHFHAQFAADVPTPVAARMAATQRPVTQEALAEPSGARPLWKELPSWFLFGSEDRSIPAAAQHFMAERARARETIEIPGASHAIVVSHPDATGHLILEAARRLWRDSALGIAA